MDKDTKKKTGLKKVLSIIVDVVIAIFLAFSVLIAVLSITSSGNGGVPTLFGKALFTIQSGSMEPTFYKGDLIIGDVNYKPDELAVGDVITFWAELEDESDSRYINTHRIVGITKEESDYVISTKGDNNVADDEYTVNVSDNGQNDVIARWNPVGKEKGILIKGMGNILDFLRSRNGLLYCLVIPLSLFFIWALYKFILSLVRYKEKDKTDEEKAAIEKAAIEKYILEHGGTLPGAASTGSAPDAPNAPGEPETPDQLEVPDAPEQDTTADGE